MIKKQKEAKNYPRLKQPVLSIVFLIILVVGYFLNPPILFPKRAGKPTLKTKDMPFAPTLTSVPTQTPQIIYKPKINPAATTEEWGVSKQIATDTWSMLVGEDKRMATPQEIFEALNIYRQRHGKNALSYDQKLADYAQSRAESFNQAGNIDAHSGFKDFINNQDGFKKLGFSALGENSSFGYRLFGVHIIEWVYAGDKPHDDNQLSSSWSHVGIGVKGTATNLIFGGNKM